MSNSALVGFAGVISVNNVNVAEVRSYSIELTSDTIETTTMGGANSGRTYVKGLSSFSGTADVFFIATHFSTADLDGLINGDVGAVPVALKIFPTGTGQNFTGGILVTGYSLNSSVDGLIEASISFQGNGQLTLAAN